jgi:hypothetical protein
MPATTVSRARLWTSRALTVLVVAFLLMDATMKVLKAAPAVQGTAELGYPAGSIVGIGLLLLACTALYVIPRTSILGALLLTGYLGGAIASQVRVGNPLFSHVFFPVYFGAVIWGALYLRDPRIRTILFLNPARAHA